MSLAPKNISSGHKTWFLYSLFALVCAFLSYQRMSVGAQLFIFAVGIVGPLLWAVRWFEREDRAVRLDFQREFFPPLSPWIIPAGLLLAIFLRVYRLDDLFYWPNGDEGLNGMFGIGLSQRWDWRFFYTCGMAAPPPVWAAALLEKAGASSSTALWAPAAVVSFLTLLAGYASARFYFSKSLSLTIGALFAFSYWPLFMGRFCHQGTWLPLWICLSFYFLGLFLKSPAGPRRTRRAFFLGLVLGLGSFTFTPWPSGLVPIFIAAFGVPFFKSFKPKGALLPFLSAFLLALIPFLTAAARENYLGHFGNRFILNDWLSPGRQFLHSFSYVSALFWGPLEDHSSYTAAFGGSLNPILGGAFFLGAVKLLKNRAHPWIQWSFLAFLAFLAPGLLSMNVELFRVALVMPLLFFYAAVGCQSLLAPVSARKRIWLLLILLGASLTIDSFRLLKSHPDPGRFPLEAQAQGVRAGDWRAYQIIRQVSSRWGKGLIFSEFSESILDQALFTMTYDLNIAENPGLSREKIGWAAVITNVHYRPFLASDFPRAKWFEVSGDLGGEGDQLLGIIPVTKENAPRLNRWVEAHHYFRSLSRAVNQICEKNTYAEAERIFEQKPSLLAGDRFLESCFWDRRAEFYYHFNYREHYADHLRALQGAIEKGYPSAHLYYRLGSLYLRKRNFNEARKAYEKACLLEPAYPEAREALEFLKSHEISGAAVK